MQYKIDTSVVTNASLFTNLYNTEPLMKEISLIALSGIQKNITSGIGPANAPLTTAVKQGNNTLRDNGGLMSSLNERHTNDEAIVSSSHIAAFVNHPEDGRKEIVIKPKNAKYLTIPASKQTRTFQRRYGFKPREVIEGLQRDGWIVFRPLDSAMKRPMNIILAQKKVLKKGSKQEAIKLFVLKKSVTVPVREFFFLDEAFLSAIDTKVMEYFK